MQEFTQMAFAKKAGVSKVAVSKAVKAGKLKLTKKKKIDLESASAVVYLNSQLDRKRKEIEKDRERAQLAEIDRQAVSKKSVNKESVKAKVKKKPEPVDSELSYQRGGGNDDFNPDELIGNLEYHKIQKEKTSNEKIKLEIATKLGELIPKTTVKSYFGKISAVVVNFFFPIGDRLSSAICGELGINDTSKKAIVKQLIDREITRGMDEVKKACKL